MKYIKNSQASIGVSNKQLNKSSHYLLDNIILLRRNIIKTQPPIQINKIICKNGCRLGSD